MQKNIKKIGILLLSIMLVLCFTSTICFASGGGNFDIDGFEGGGAPEKVTGLAKDGLGAAIAAIRVAAAGILVIMIVVISIKYMTSSAGDRADIKKHAVAYVVAALIIFGSTFIIEVLIKIAGDIGGE